MSKHLAIAPPLLDEIRAAAKRAHPNECCGLIIGIATPSQWRAASVHETANVADDRSRSFLLDPPTLLRLNRQCRRTGQKIIGCFHSHPNGRAVPSERDRSEAINDNFLWLIESGGNVQAYVFDVKARGFTPVELVAT